MKTKWKPVFFLPLITVLLDQYSKLVVIKHFYLGESIDIISNFFNLTYVRNTGAAFGIMADTPVWFRIPFFIIVPLFALGVISYLFKKLEDHDWKMASALSLVIGGAIGNLIDRVRLGYVIDFLDFHWKYQAHFPAFNIADSAICIGVGVLLLDIFKQNPNEIPNVPHTS